MSAEQKVVVSSGQYGLEQFEQLLVDEKLSQGWFLTCRNKMYVRRIIDEYKIQY